jgi:hypothetical protein
MRVVQYLPRTPHTGTSMKSTLLRWQADEPLNQLIRRYYSGEAGLWNNIRSLVDAELRRRQVDYGLYHLRLLSRHDGGYDVLIESADDYAIDP